LSERFGTVVGALESQRQASVKAMARRSPREPTRCLGEPAEKSRAVIARRLQGLTEFDAVLGFEVAARQIIGAREGHEGRLPLQIHRADGVAHGGRERPVGIQRQRAGVRCRIGRAIAMFGRDRSRSCSNTGSTNWSNRSRRAGTPAESAAPSPARRTAAGGAGGHQCGAAELDQLAAVHDRTLRSLIAEVRR
jgi:hypothetical protein